MECVVSYEVTFDSPDARYDSVGIRAGGGGTPHGGTGGATPIYERRNSKN